MYSKIVEERGPQLLCNKKKCKEMVNYKEVGKTGSEVYACRK